MAGIIYLWPAPPLLLGISFSRAVYDSHHQLLRLTLSHDEQYRLYTPLSDITKDLANASLLEEDQYFHWHPGINPVSLIRASLQTYFIHSRRIGASTITMQVARMRYGIHSKTFSGKILQIIRALQLEAHYSKDQILEAYLNLAPYGNNIEGVGAASLIYFSKPASALSLPEAMTLAVIPQNPSKRLPSNEILKLARNHLYDRWLTLHPADADKHPLFNLPLAMRSIHQSPFLAPHLVNELLAVTDTDKQIVTTLDLKLQQSIEQLAKHYLARKSALGINNTAIMLVDTRNMETKVLLGSANFYNTAIQGQINGTKTKRSPGSALKPFIYALAIDQGLIHPNTVLKDVPHSFGHYNPENFDNDFAGPIKAKDALTLSRNIPAVALAEQLKHPTLYEFLQQAGITHLKPESYYGLALVLGGTEVSMQEMVELYAALANQGWWHPLKFTKNQMTVAGKRLFSPEASFLVTEMLKETSRPAGAFSSTHADDLPIAWKTGTSSGYRDAWTIGTVGPYVLAVWIGNFNNESNQAFIGKETAAPLFFEISSMLNLQKKSLATTNFSNHLNLTKVEVCKASGMLPNRNCQDKEKVWFIPGKSPIKVDTIHREIAIDSRTGFRACEFNQYTRFEVFEFWSSDILAIYKRAGMQHRSPPEFNANCRLQTQNSEGLSPQIISPQTEVRYVARIATDNHTLLPLTTVVDADVKNVYWFINENFVGKTSRDKPLLWHATPGHFVVRVVDDYGRSDARDINVILL